MKKFAYLSVVVGTGFVVAIAAACGGGGGSSGSTELVCASGASGTLTAAAAVVVPAGEAKDLAGAAVAAEAHTTLPAAAVSIACAPDILPAGYIALGPAVLVGPEGTSSDRPFLVTLPYKAARLPEGAGRRHVRIVAKRARGDGATPFFPAVANLKLDDVDTFASRATFRAQELTTYQVVAAADAGQPKTRHYKYRAVAGVSMGGGAATSVGLRSDRFDVIGTLGGDPGSDAVYFGNFAREYVFGGFCTAEHQAAGLGNIGELCVAQQRAALADQFEIPSDFEHQLYQSGSGVGLTLRRNLYIKGSRDLSRSFGNPALYNPDNPYLPPGVPDAWLTQPAADRCANPLVLPMFFDREYNPDGLLPVITFCDGGDSAALGLGTFDQELPQENPFEVILAVDVNGNGRRDYGEPIVTNGSEPYLDVGVDAVADVDEPGYDATTNPDPSGDDYHFLKNPNGTEKNGDREEGEPYEDVGLDGVAGTCQLPGAGCYDWGEGDGAWTLNPNLEMYWYNKDVYKTLAQMTPAQRENISIWADAGIRDFFNSHVCANNMTGHMSAMGMPMAVFDDFTAIAKQPNGLYDFNLVDWYDQPQNMYVRYGNPDATASQIEGGDGRHVGTAQQLIARITSLFAWMDARWPNGDREIAPSDENNFLDDEHFISPTTGRDNPYSLFLPPGYFENPNLRYPVVYFLHGYGQEPQDLVAVSAIFGNYMIDPDRMKEKRFQKMMIVYVDGRCRPGGDGVPTDPTGDQCEQGTFYTDSPVNARAQMETHLLELMDYIDATYRTKAEEDVTVVP